MLVKFISAFNGQKSPEILFNGDFPYLFLLSPPLVAIFAALNVLVDCEHSPDQRYVAKDFFRETIDDIHQHLLYLIFYFQGEPYLNPDFLEMVKYASEKNIYTATSTNAHYLTDEAARKTVESGLDRLIISIDGTTQDVYEQYRIGGKLDKVIEGTKNIIKWRKALNSKTPFVFFSSWL